MKKSLFLFLIIFTIGFSIVTYAQDTTNPMVLSINETKTFEYLDVNYLLRLVAINANTGQYSVAVGDGSTVIVADRLTKVISISGAAAMRGYSYSSSTLTFEFVDPSLVVPEFDKCGETGNVGDEACEVCGNNIINGDEICDGSTKDCSAFLNTWTGTASCKNDCTGFETSTCNKNNAENPSCIDSDGGLNFYQLGEITGSLASDPDSSSKDICISPEGTLRELFCNYEGKGEPQLFKCPNGCSNGICISENNLCIDSDDGLNYYTHGSITGNMPEGFISEDICIAPEGRLREVVCDNDFGSAHLYDCPYGCSDGKCKRENVIECKDSDNGKDFQVKGTVTFDGVDHTDYCIPNQDLTLVEAFCENDFQDLMMYECPNGCSDGRCLESCNGCIIDESCIPFGSRLDDTYCSLNKQMENQLTGESICSNSYECTSNLCIDGTCVEQGLFNRIIQWFLKLF